MWEEELELRLVIILLSVCCYNIIYSSEHTHTHTHEEGESRPIWTSFSCSLRMSMVKGFVDVSVYFHIAVLGQN